jgi:hypothetical protein
VVAILEMLRIPRPELVSVAVLALLVVWTTCVEKAKLARHGGSFAVWPVFSRSIIPSSEEMRRYADGLRGKR